MPDKKEGILEALAANEEKISSLYAVYADAYPDYYNFWFMLSSDEVSHASWLRSLDASWKKGTLAVDEKRFALAAVKTFGEYLDEKIKEARGTKYLMDKALNIAFDIENALIEKGWFTMFEAALSEDKVTLDRLIKTLGVHKSRVVDMTREFRHQ